MKPPHETPPLAPDGLHSGANGVERPRLSQLLIERVSPHFSALKASRVHTPAIGKLLAVRVSEDYQTKLRNTFRYWLGLPHVVHEDTYLST